ncbi:MAG: aminotransferase class I/II-fold pyridoxal phosphate-dependent enzyme [Bdellovibrionaceae bacterium]|nr:aminotransferase class I/II-fold pyridoxal phosphate-dependent enzyme [Pseudobdellovibrionaceae bacterium]
MSTLATLTEIEVLGLNSECNMADGHAYHDLAPAQSLIIRDLPALWTQAQSKKHRDAEIEFKHHFLTLANSPSIAYYPHFRICPTASNSIDAVATWLKEKNMSTLLVEPTFDNLALILKRRGVAIDSIQEYDIPLIAKNLLNKNFGALFLVNPNNPTGRLISKSEFVEIVDWCKTHGKVLLLDNTFRFFVSQDYDMYEVLNHSKVTYISIEDTGKVWPTQDLKVSLLFFSADIADEMNLIYEEIYLCVSNFQLEILGQFLKDSCQRGLAQAVWAEVAERRERFRNIIAGSPLQIHEAALNSKISVEWVKVTVPGWDDFSMLQHFKESGLVVLPGRHFYWNANGPKISHNSLRFSLLKTKMQFEQSMNVLRKSLETLSLKQDLAV